MPNFEVPKMEIPAAYREFAEKSVSQAKANYEKMKTVADEATDALEDAYTTVSNGVAECGHKMIEAARSNANANFDFATQLMGVKSISEVVELSTAHARKQMESFSSQSKDFASLAQKVTAETTEPVKECFSKVFTRVG
jgi:phasin